MGLLGDQEGTYSLTSDVPSFLRSFLLYFLPSILPFILPSFHPSFLSCFPACLVAYFWETNLSRVKQNVSENVLQSRVFILSFFFLAVTGNKDPSSSTSFIIGSCLGVLSLVTCVVIGLFRYRRSRRGKEVNLSDIYMTYRSHTNVSKHYWWPYLKIIFTWACLAARLWRPWKLGIRIVTCQSAKYPREEGLGKINAKHVTWVQRHNPL